jgi:hypothetical protein
MTGTDAVEGTDVIRLSTIGRTLRVSAAILISLLATNVGASEQERPLHVPEDKSWEVKSYKDSGVPDPAVSWSMEEYQTALGKLSELGGTELPRLGSKRSGLVFQRLLITQLGFPDSALPTGGPTLAALYGLHREDRLFFDRELVAIRAARLKAIVAEAPSVDEIRAVEGDVSAQYQRAGSASERAQKAEMLQIYSELLGQSSQVLREQVQGLLYLASLKETSPGARADLVTELNAVVPMLGGRMVKNDTGAIANELLGLSRLDWNQRVAADLSELAARVQSVQAG